jgi:hypothetical protein
LSGRLFKSRFFFPVMRIVLGMAVIQAVIQAVIHAASLRAVKNGLLPPQTPKFLLVTILRKPPPGLTSSTMAPSPPIAKSARLPCNHEAGPRWSWRGDGGRTSHPEGQHQRLPWLAGQPVITTTCRIPQVTGHSSVQDKQVSKRASRVRPCHELIVMGLAWLGHPRCRGREGEENKHFEKTLIADI